VPIVAFAKPSGRPAARTPGDTRLDLFHDAFCLGGTHCQIGFDGLELTGRRGSGRGSCVAVTVFSQRECLRLSTGDQAMAIAAKVKSYLDAQGFQYELIGHYLTGSSHESAEAAHIDEGHIAKAVILTGQQGPVMAVVPGDSWVSLSAVQRMLDRELVLAQEDETASLFADCDQGAIPPLGPAYGIETLLDEALVSLAFHYFESGDHQTLLKVRGEDFLKLLGGARRGHFSTAD
jgi:Ala-tRNA(Pro) deacylase